MQDKTDKTRLRDGQYAYAVKKDLFNIWSDKEKTEIINKFGIEIINSINTQTRIRHIKYDAVQSAQ